MHQPPYEPAVERETVLARIHAPTPARPAILAVLHAFDARTADVAPNAMVVEMTGPPARVDSFIDVLRPFGLAELMRSGPIRVRRGGRTPRAAVLSRAITSRPAPDSDAAAGLGSWSDPANAQADGMH